MNIKNITYNIELYRECYTDSSGINLLDKSIYEVLINAILIFQLNI